MHTAKAVSALQLVRALLTPLLASLRNAALLPQTSRDKPKPVHDRITHINFDSGIAILSRVSLRSLDVPECTLQWVRPRFATKFNTGESTLPGRRRVC
ncbi:hypothetical protein OF83DRAFT_1106366 [Amylostereum chailletii]|nr:hypothetical protein OF83DRAFT_1106366 [Amylostereum chailletii]